MAKGRPDAHDDRSAKESATEVWGLVRDYAKQETVEPLKGLVTYLKWGVVGSLVLAIGIIELVLAVLRAVQAEGGGTLDGRWSWVPYVVTLAGRHRRPAAGQARHVRQERHVSPARPPREHT